VRPEGNVYLTIKIHELARLAIRGEGLGAALITVPFFKSALFYVNVFDWEAFVIAFSAVGIAAMFACLTPAMTAMLIESLKALKE
jgi:hypothetical protein